MNKRFLGTVVVTGILLLTAANASAQGGAKKGPEVARDPDMEQDSLHNLEVARQYFKLRKAYVASLERCEEVLAGNPAFSKIDEILFMAGASSLNLSEAKGKQKPDQYVIREGEKKTTLTPQEFRDKARDYLSQLVNDYPQSKFREDALANLKSLGGAKPKPNNAPPETAAQKTKSNNKRSNH
ncbi:MAG TPA: outer membrane protein assembly factor BamD [Pyrinomonadaceae bacterium]|jgi:outer membrane protein assembly factor BamD (BamD/ComL family)|nr:outer membrane protein assembly factor BamD [Pyrinomonadaceae bacterium]